MKKSALVILLIINLPLLTSDVYAGSFESTFENGPYAIAETKCDKSWLSGRNDIADLRPNMVAYESEIDHNGYMMSNSLIKKSVSPPPLPTDISSPQVITEKHVQLHQSAESALSIPDIDGVQLVHLSTPPKTYYISGSAAKKHIKALKLKILSSKPNRIIDVDEWFKKNDLALPLYRVPDPSRRSIAEQTRLKDYPPLPDWIPTVYRDKHLLQAIRCDGNIVLIYGSDYLNNQYVIVASETGRTFTYAIDFAEYTANEQAIQWASFRDNILYIVNWRNGYASESKGLTAYISAIDVPGHTLLWRSNPLISNSDFEIVGDTIIAGYGFTAEPHNIFLLNKWTGQVYTKLPIKKSPEYIIRKDDKLYVRTYNADYIFQLAN